MVFLLNFHYFLLLFRQGATKTVKGHNEKIESEKAAKLVRKKELFQL